MNVDPNTSVAPFVSIDAPKSERHPGRRAAAAKRDDGLWDFQYFEDLCGAGSSESAFCTTVYDLRRAGADVDSVCDRNGRYDRAKGEWRNSNGTTITRAQLLERFGQHGERP